MQLSGVSYDIAKAVLFFLLLSCPQRAPLTLKKKIAKTHIYTNRQARVITVKADDQPQKVNLHEGEFYCIRLPCGIKLYSHFNYSCGIDSLHSSSRVFFMRRDDLYIHNIYRAIIYSLQPTFSLTVIRLYATMYTVLCNKSKGDNLFIAHFKAHIQSTISLRE